ncbi:MAG: GGDEF domain-containing protein [Sphingomonadaceae bacterium]|uniref:GGDEF domain-containing protein n=1 Tax=Thermaurantiacus sp. TaxID=2820283 RepID=UPI00298F0463|nr:GGDEF domain-containing protein [Thermaurantiacus sp.]MCS6987283.1 GGDEF domain-containing protein [Sphingomonadaceae bacterium]MDW8414503.1 GGDEF domain-containing protein [Thermaurantiacus sp.]
MLAAAALAALALERHGRLVRARRDAHTDPLTGLPNRRGLAAAWPRRRQDAALELMFIDLVGFRHVNGAHGHAIGDAVLQEVARRFRRSLPATAWLARVGGDEFVAVGPPDTAAALTASLAQPIALPDGRYVTIGLRIGRAPVLGLDLGTALARAQSALAKVA